MYGEVSGYGWGEVNGRLALGGGDPIREGGSGRPRLFEITEMSRIIALHIRLT